MQEQRLKDYERMKKLALALLILMAFILVFTHFLPKIPALAGFDGPWIGYIQAFAEAGLVGGIADWFAVTALFRHPLGIPIPHTAIVPKNKIRLGRALGDFIRDSFLDPVLLASRMQAQNFALQLGQWLGRGGDKLIARRLRGYSPALAQQLRSEPVRNAVGRVFQSGLSKWNASPTLARVFEAMMDRDYHHKLVHQGIDLALSSLNENQDVIKDRISSKSWKWVPSFVDRKIAQKLIDGSREYLGELANPDHPFHQDIERRCQEYAARLQSDPDLQERIAAHKEKFLKDPALAQGLMKSWDEFTETLEQHPERFANGIQSFIQNYLAEFGARLRNDTTFQAKFNDWLEKFVIASILPWRIEVGNFVAGVVERWDSQTITSKIEEGVGKDLQYIRINGTLVGGLVGVVLYTLVQVLP